MAGFSPVFLRPCYPGSRWTTILFRPFIPFCELVEGTRDDRLRRYDRFDELAKWRTEVGETVAPSS